MEFIADLHIHSKYSRATAKNLDFENLYRAAQMKGITLIGTGDFTYPAWISEIESKLEETEPGLYSLKKQIAADIDKTIPENCRNPVRFILQTEISNIYKKDGRVRKNHNLIYFPDIASVKKFNARLDAIGNIKSDGRPILGMDAADLLRIMLEVNDKGFFVPAHIWTPWFSMFGSKSGFDSIEACFGILKSHIFAVETGLSSDPPMNWRIEDLDNVRLISNSDAHSPGYIGRNASVFNTDLSFFNIRQALEINDPEKYQGTLDMYPHQGKYHYDGHRKCNVCLNPAATAQVGGVCPECGRKVTYGVLNRVQELATRPEGYVPENRHGFKHIIPLVDILSEIFGVGPKTKKVAAYYTRAIEALGPELQILVNKSVREIASARIPLLAEAITKMRTGDIGIDPGYDGEFGKVNLFTAREKQGLKGEKALLFDLAVEADRIEEKKEIERPWVKTEKINKQHPLEQKARPKPKGLLDGLNAGQKRAVESPARAMVIQAGPGTGKTLTLTAKIAYLVSQKKIEPGNILALTFTNKAARELEHRIDRYLPKTKHGVTAATFHSFCLALLKEHKGFNAVIANESLRIFLIKEAIREATGKDARKAMTNKIDQLICVCKQNLLDPEDELKDMNSDVVGEAFKHIYKAFQALCQEQNVADFEDLILMTVKLLGKQEQILSTIRKKYRYIFIDEYQDLNYGQYELVKMISKGNHIVVIGDPDQSIYGFRGSDNKYFNRFARDFGGCEKIVLIKNYRSTQTILDASFQMIHRHVDRDEKLKVVSGFKGLRKLIVKETDSELSEAVAIGKMIEKLVGGISFFSMDTGKADLDIQKEYSFSDFAILCRTRKQFEIFIKVFEKEGIPFQTADKTNLFEMSGIVELISLCRIMAKSDSFLDLEIIFNYFGAGLDKEERQTVYTVYKKSCALNRDIMESIVLSDISWAKEATKIKIKSILKKLKTLQETIKSCDTNTCINILCRETGLQDIIESNDKIKQAFDRILSIAPLYNDLKEFVDAIALNLDADAIGFHTEAVSVMTMHAAKGLEFPVVFIAGCEQGLVPFAKDGENCEDLEEERRLFYVAMTRAMDILCLTYAKKRTIYGRRVKRQRSSFIGDIEKRLTQVEKRPVFLSADKREKQLELFQ